MFSDVITSTALTTNAAETYFGEKFNGSAPWGDVSFISTMRALLSERTGNENVYFDFSGSGFSMSDFRNCTSYAEKVNHIIISSYYAFEDSNHIIRILNLDCAIHDDLMDYMQEGFTEAYPGWKPLDKIGEFYKKQFRILCYINPGTKSVLLVVGRMKIEWFHYLQASILAFLPWYFDPEKGISEEEMELIQSLRDKTSTRYLACCEKIAGKYDFRIGMIKSKLADFETRFERSKIAVLERNITNYINSINSMYNDIASLIRKKRDAELQIVGLNDAKNGKKESGEVMEYFLSNDRLVLEEVDDCYMMFGIKDYLVYYDEDVLRTLLDNPRSYLYRPNGSSCENIMKMEDVRRVFEAMMDGKVKFRFCSMYKFEFGVRAYGVSGWDYSSEYSGYLPNAHIHRFACLGGYESTLNDLVQKNDYLTAIDQCMASCRSLNVGESTTFKIFMDYFYGISTGYGTVSNRFIELPDGNVVTPKECVEYLNKQEETANG